MGSFNLERLVDGLEDVVEECAEQALQDISEDLREYVPYKTGSLDSSMVVDKDSKSIYWTAEHAEYVYTMPKENNFNRKVHTKATSYWVEEAEKDMEEKWLERISANVRRRLG